MRTTERAHYCMRMVYTDMRPWTILGKRIDSDFSKSVLIQYSYAKMLKDSIVREWTRLNFPAGMGGWSGSLLFQNHTFTVSVWLTKISVNGVLWLLSTHKTRCEKVWVDKNGNMVTFNYYQALTALLGFVSCGECYKLIFWGVFCPKFCF